MKTRISNLVAIAIMMFTGISLVNAQQVYNLSSGSELKVSGTSSLHDWTMKSSKGSGKATFTVSVDGNEIQGISALQVVINVQTLKSGKGGMDDKAYEALKAKNNKNITFTLTEMKSLKQSGDAITFTAVGDLTVAGVKRPVTLTGKGKAGAETFQFEGSTKVKMTDFKIEPPTAVFGTIKTGDEITLSFNATFKKSDK
ncbi:MAG: YceI family protein [Bacteroidota bacterium]